MHPYLAWAGKLTTLYSFAGGAQGYSPVAGLTYGNGVFYGVTGGGGAFDNGIVFSLTSSGSETVLYSFPNDGDFTGPNGKLIFGNGVLYGTTTYGGADGNGTVFRVDPATGAKTVLHSFGHGKDGSYPDSLVLVSGTLYGMTAQGGLGGVGTLFAIDSSTGDEKLLHSFNGTDGKFPTGDLAFNNGMLYGTTSLAGVNEAGLAFTFDVKTKQISTLFDRFPGNGFAYLTGGVIYESGILYGVQTVTAVNECCTNVYALNATTGAEATIHSFREGRNYTYANGGLADQNGTLYGTFRETGGCGLVYKFTINTSKYAPIYRFHGTDGCKPNSDLIYVNSALFGTTQSGGASDAGTVFELTP